MRFAILAIATLVLSTGGVICAAPEEGPLFELLASDNLALAQRGGYVQGSFVRKLGSISCVDIPDVGKVIEFKNPGSGKLSFPVDGNLPAEEGCVVIRQAFRYDGPSLLSKLKERGQWSYMLFLFNTEGVGLFHEVNANMDASDSIRLTAMFSYGPSLWQYEGVTLRKDEFPAGGFFDVFLSWKGREIALGVNGKVLRRATLKAPPVWGGDFSIGGTGGNSFDGWIQSFKIYGGGTWLGQCKLK